MRYFSNPSIGHWIYKVGDIEFYIPNYGHVLVFDSRYVDIHNELIECEDPCDDGDYTKCHLKFLEMVIMV